MTVILVSTLSGCAIGLLIGYVGSCTTGSCPMTSNPFVSAVIGGIFGLLYALGR